jgi:rSAM/selenodomain-associated transferase 2
MNLLPGKKWFSWQRVLCLLITVGLLCFIVRRIDFDAFLASLKRMRPGWFVLAFIAYGVALWLGSIRWHLALQLTRTAVHPSASVRLFLIGHFFFVALFGAAGGDFAKSAVYARWYGFGLPEVIAAAPLDRGLGGAGPLLLMGIMFGIAGANGGFEVLSSLEFEASGVWLLLALGIGALALIAVLFCNPQGESSWARTIRAFRSGGSRLIVTPRIALPGLAAAMLAQLGLSAVLALNLHAVTNSPVSWAQLAWTFPVITVFSCLPFTIAGAGVREIASLTLLGIYGVPAGDCVTASVLTFVHKVAWAGIGAGLLWHEETLRVRQGPEPLLKTISVVIPTLNEEQSLGEAIRHARAVIQVSEIIVVDGGSTDGTRNIAEQYGCRVLVGPPGRGGQMRMGAKNANGDIVLLLHADTWLPPEAGPAAINCLRDPLVAGGGFWKVFRQTPWLMLGSRWRCAVRLLIGRRIAGDQAMFVRRSTLEAVGGVPDMPLMEEFELCRRLRTVGRLALADATVSTSARRFQKQGIVRTYLRMWKVAALYRLGTSPKELLRHYDKS